ncbi:UDP-N-acetylmuramoyl-tripeptide--D-alanyl-D-alanine ligase [bacterium]|nr:UDP-N-acetylmuramoyl-tripeptide--D-alanyl-D-alanine ligase [bacterium]
MTLCAWSINEIADAVRGRMAADADYPETYTAICTDTRAIQPGCLFVPLVGERFDGHDFVGSALQAGAGAALWARGEVPAELKQAPLIGVDDTLDAYQALGSHNLRRLGIPAVAVTGSVGKTTTKDLLRALLGLKYKVHATPVNHNNDVGAAKTLLELGPEHQLAIIEMGMRGRGQIRRLARLVRAKAGVITAIGESHMELLGSQRAIAEAKAELFEEMDSSSLAVYPADAPYASVLAEHTVGRSCTFSLRADSAAAWRLLEYRPQMLADGGLGSYLQIAYPGGKTELLFSRPGLHNASNLLAALAVCYEFGIAPEEARSALEGFRSTGQRIELVHLASGLTLIDDAYNAAPSSVRGALEVMEQAALYRQKERLPHKRRCVAVLGDMLELGADSPELHRQIGEACAERGIDLLIGVGELSAANMVPEARKAGIKALCAADREEAWLLLSQELMADDVVLVKASHSIGLEYVSEKLREWKGA